MILLPVGLSSNPPAPLGARRSRKLTPALMAAIGVSVSAHVAIGVYLYTHKFFDTAPKIESDTPIIVTMPTIRPAPPIVNKSTPRKTQPDANVRKATDNVLENTVDTSGLTPTLPLDPGTVTKAPDPPKTPTAPKIIQPRWIALPTGDQLADAYPQRALDLGRTGAVELSCTVTATGAIRECAVQSETPTGYGFGAAAQKLTRYFRMTPKTEDGRPVEGGVVRVPIQFKLAD